MEPPPSARPAALRPAAEPVDDIVPPDLPAEAGVERARSDVARDRLPDAADEDDRGGEARATLDERLRRAEQRRDSIAARVSRLRERVNAPVIKDVEAYQRLQVQLASALDEQDRAEAQVARLRARQRQE
jgi:hypothetical protein